MEQYLEECAEVFLKEQGKLFDEPVAETIEEAKEFLEDCFAQVFENIVYRILREDVGLLIQYLPFQTADTLLLKRKR